MWKIGYYDINGNPIGEQNPENLQFGKFLSRVSFVNYDAGRIDTPIAPYKTDFRLMRDDVPLMGGMTTEISSTYDSETLSVSGQSYLHYFEKRMFPFNPANPAQYLFIRNDVDCFAIIEQMLNVVLAEPNSLQFTYNNGVCGHTLDLVIEPGDTGTIFDKISGLAEEEPGFDFEETYDRQFKMYAPKKERNSNYRFEQGRNIFTISEINRGPTASHFFAYGQGGSIKLGSVYVSTATAAQFRRMDTAQDFQDVIDMHALDRLALGMSKRGIVNQVEITAQIRPDEEFWNTVQLGDKCTVVGRTEYEDISGIYRLVGYQASVSNTGEETLDGEFEPGEV